MHLFNLMSSTPALPQEAQYMISSASTSSVLLLLLMLVMILSRSNCQLIWLDVDWWYGIIWWPAGRPAVRCWPCVAEVRGARGG